jgi:hypothetical protein
VRLGVRVRPGGALVIVAVVRVVAMPVVQIVNVADVFERLVTAVDAVNVLVGLDVRVVLCVDRHGSTPDQVSASRQLSHLSAAICGYDNTAIIMEITFN